MRLTFILSLSLLAACDSDGDGISNADEKAAGTDPDAADTDGDGLKDAREQREGTDPTLADTDGDGLEDGEELDSGSDPLVADGDADGLNDGEERDNGTDPTLPDSDGDGLLDGEERDIHGTDPAAADSDDDGYNDGAEIDAGTDALDPESVIYKGGWPYNANKDQIDDPKRKAANEVGTVLRGAQLLDQYGDMVDLYDFMGQGKPVIIDISAMWCGPCNAWASFLSGGTDSYNLGGSYPTLREHIENEEIYWITILFDDESGADPDLSDLQRWYKAYPDPMVPVLADDSSTMATTYAQWYPYFILVDSDGFIVATPGTNQNNSYKAIDKALSMVEGG